MSGNASLEISLDSRALNCCQSRQISWRLSRKVISSQEHLRALVSNFWRERKFCELEPIMQWDAFFFSRNKRVCFWKINKIIREHTHDKIQCFLMGIFKLQMKTNVHLIEDKKIIKKNKFG